MEPALSVPTFEFPSGKMPAIGLGTWKMEDGSATPAVLEALKLGYRHVDCAPIYLNEPDVGQALTAALSQGIVTREQLWVTSKLWCNRHQPDLVRGALKQTLNDLALDYLDLFMIHWPIAFRAEVHRPESAEDFVPLSELPLSATWQAMEECVDEGLCRNLGVCNFSRARLGEILSNCRIRPAANQVECHPYLPQSDLKAYCDEQQIRLVAYSPLGSGDRPDRMRDAADPNLFEDPVLQRWAAQQDITVGQMLLAWAVHRGTAAIPKSSDPGRQAANLAAASLKLPSEALDAIDRLSTRHRFVHGKFWEVPGGPYTAAGLWGNDQ